jgi:phosphoglycerate dehydrogenase-like enzyme
MPDVIDEVFPADVRRRLRYLVEIDTGRSLEDFGTPEARRRLSDVEILVTGWGCPVIDGSVLDATPKLRAIVHAAGSVKEVIAGACWERGIVVSSAADANARPVAEYTIAMCVLTAKRAFRLARAYAAGDDVHAYQAGRSPALTGATVGVIGASRIGRIVISMLRQYEADVLVYDPYLTTEEAAELGAEPADLDTLCRRSDIVSVHAPETPQTRHLLDDRRLGLMTDGSAVINTARGSLVDTDALTRHCAQGRLDAVLDVTEPEPLPPGHPLLTLPNVLVTTHVAGAHGREVRRLGEFAVAEVWRFVTGRPLHGLVAAADLSRLA